MKKAILSVCNKENILIFAAELVVLNYEILATTGTFCLLKEAGIPAQKIEDYTGTPELLEGQVKTLHPKIFEGILQNNPSIQLVVCNLYPLEKGEIDIGGCALLRAAAKNREEVLALCDPRDYEEVLRRLKNSEIDGPFKRSLAAKVFQLTAAYDAAIAASLTDELFPDRLVLSFTKQKELAYGENPDQRGAIYVDGSETTKQIQGKTLSFNNILDIDAAAKIVSKFAQPACAIIKHNNPCAVAVRESSEGAWKEAWEADPLCAFGGVVAFNCGVDLKTARLLQLKFLEVVIAPDYDVEALSVLKEKEGLRVLKLSQGLKRGISFKEILGGLLYQTSPLAIDENTFEVVTKMKPTKAQMRDLIFALQVNEEVKSNSIVIAKEEVTMGIGAGQMSRIDSTFLALYKAKGKAEGAVLSSDGFFPFADSIEMAAKANIAAIIQPGGSKKDQEVIEACDREGIAMVFTKKRLFKH